jgi:hypothetical protein
MPLAISDSELDAVLAAARPLPVECRDAFLQSVASALQGCREICVPMAYPGPVPTCFLVSVLTAKYLT